MIKASIATIGRSSLNQAVESLRSQVDCIEIHYNACKPLGIGDIEIHHEVNQGDNAKFFCKEWGYYHFTCDDDILYPTDYVKRMIDSIGSNDAISCHGVFYHDLPDAYYNNSYFQSKYHFRHEVTQDTPVHVLGTGVLCFRGDNAPDVSKWTTKNMSDLWASLHFKRKICLSHEEGWLKQIDNGPSIYEREKAKDFFQTDLVKRIYRNGFF